jgi:hypothetical protein
MWYNHSCHSPVESAFLFLSNSRLSVRVPQDCDKLEKRQVGGSLIRGTMKEIKLSQGKVALVDDGDFEWLNQWRWAAHKNGYVFYVVRVVYTPTPKTIQIHRLITNAPKGMVVDHINGDGLDNRRENLRLCTVAENNKNRRRNSNNTSGYKGVRRDTYKYKAAIKSENKLIHLGMFSSPEDAARAYDKAAKEIFGKFAKLNFPEEC